MTSVLARISSRTSWLFSVWNTFLVISFLASIDVVERRHEDDSIHEIFCLNVIFVHVSDFPAERQRSVPWENLPLEHDWVSIIPVQLTIRNRWCKPLNSVRSSLYRWLIFCNFASKTQHRIWEDAYFCCRKNLITCSYIKVLLIHGVWSQSIVLTPNISSSWSNSNFCVMENKGRTLENSVLFITCTFSSKSFPRCTAALIDAVINNPQIIALVLACSILSSFGRPSCCRTYVKTFTKNSTLLGNMAKLWGNTRGPMVIFIDLATSFPVLKLGSMSVSLSWESDALLLFESIGTGFTILIESRVDKFAVRFLDLESRALASQQPMLFLSTWSSFRHSGPHFWPLKKIGPWCCLNFCQPLPDHMYPSGGFSFNIVNWVKPSHGSDSSWPPSTFQQSSIRHSSNTSNAVFVRLTTSMYSSGVANVSSFGT